MYMYNVHTMPFTFVYRTADIHLCAILAKRKLRDISCSVHKSEWYSICNFLIIKTKIKMFENFRIYISQIDQMKFFP